MICLKALPSPRLHLPLVSSSSPLRRLRPSTVRAAAAAAISSAPTAIAAPIEHIVLIKVRPEVAASGAAAAMVSSLQALSTLVPGLSYIHAGPVLRLRSPAAEALGPTHLLHSRYATKPDLAAYATHPAHVAAVQAHVIPNALDTTAIDWVNAAALPSPVSPGAAVRLTLAKVKEGVEVGLLVEKVAAATAAAGDARGARVSFGENFSPARAKGYQFGMVAVFDSVEELDGVEGDRKVEEAKATVRPMLDEVLVLDFVVGDAPAAESFPISLAVSRKMGGYYCLLHFFLVCALLHVHGGCAMNKTCNPTDLEVLLALCRELERKGTGLVGWGPNDVVCCSWTGVSCDLGRVVGLDLSNKSLHGVISSSVTSLDSLVMLNLSRNSLSGQEPAGLGWLTSLRLLDLSANALSGKFLASGDGGSFLAIEVVNVSSNDFTGPHPVFPGGVVNLTVLDISSNAFSNSINVTALCAAPVKVLRFSVNAFTGEVPAGFSRCKVLAELSLDGNGLGGSLPGDRMPCQS